ncbi:(2Fe-2S) ferredoxin domain-containing protein [Krasilnikovia cinnamomea]|uniref:(2Fe-2S) ferredoxin domain-containing protein n=1 Tax=Krasilnikovia cinnamomea TaxID=349313 RepID=UPI001F5FE306|nr:(2Fe-2S) ferredoxin domain-containing protein [Krasilnikovia cinnamomea]
MITTTAAGLVTCRGCCCGNPAKHPDVDHGGELRTLQQFAADHPDTVRLTTSDCLGPCEHANVLVVRPSPDGRRAGGRPVWLARLDAHALRTLQVWLAAGGPGLADVPEYLALHRIRPSRAGTTSEGSPML